MDRSLLDNAVWHSLVHTHRDLARLGEAAACYEPNVSVFAGLADDSDDAWRDLAAVLGGGAGALFSVARPVPPDGWHVVTEGTAHQMVLRDLGAVEAPDARPLGRDDVEKMLALIELARPGPFARRTIELGGYVGVFGGATLIAMAGQRLAPPGFREVSAVCTHPDFRGRGLAAGLTALVARDIVERGEWPFLHHAADNHPARRLYEALGFEFRCETSWTLLARD